MSFSQSNINNDCCLVSMYHNFILSYSNCLTTKASLSSLSLNFAPIRILYHRMTFIRTKLRYEKDILQVIFLKAASNVDNYLRKTYVIHKYGIFTIVDFFISGYPLWTLENICFTNTLILIVTFIFYNLISFVYVKTCTFYA